MMTRAIMPSEGDWIGKNGRGIARAILLGVLAIVPALLTSGTGLARTLDVGPGKTFALPSQAAAVARDGDHVEIAPGKYVDCAVWRANGLVIEGTAAGVVIADKACLDKGLFIVAGDNTTVRNLTLTGARVPDMNGSGIRLESGSLTVDGVKFVENQDGILGGQPGATVVIRNSTFLHNGVCAPVCAHGIYVGEVKLLRVENSRFFETRQGHSIKSRALRTEVLGCDIADGPNGTSSYLIDAPNGGALIVRGNILEKGPKSENHSTLIAVGEEGVTHPTPEIVIVNNDFRNDGDYPTKLLWNATTTQSVQSGNRLAGRID